jgi:hypothetical protein
MRDFRSLVDDGFHLGFEIMYHRSRGHFRTCNEIFLPKFSAVAGAVAKPTISSPSFSARTSEMADAMSTLEVPAFDPDNLYGSDTSTL